MDVDTGGHLSPCLMRSQLWEDDLENINFTGDALSYLLSCSHCLRTQDVLSQHYILSLHKMNVMLMVFCS